MSAPYRIEQVRSLLNVVAITPVCLVNCKELVARFQPAPGDVARGSHRRRHSRVLGETDGDRAALSRAITVRANIARCGGN
jgi:hypothetical protein